MPLQRNNQFGINPMPVPVEIRGVRLVRRKRNPTTATLVRMSRRTLAVAVAILLFGACDRNPVTLHLLVWEGYADPVFIRSFEVNHNCRILVSYMKTSDELYGRLKRQENVDVVSPSSDIAQILVKEGLVAPFDETVVTASKSEIASAEVLRESDRLYGVPFMWGSNLFLYNSELFNRTSSVSWRSLWDPQYQGKIAVWDDLSTIYMAAQALGCEQHSPECGYSVPVSTDPSTLFNLGPDQLDRVKEKLVALKPRQWSNARELTRLFENHDVVAGMGWSLIANQLRNEGFPVKAVIPPERTTGWIDYLMIARISSKQRLANEFVSYLLKPSTQRWVAEVTGYNPIEAGPSATLMFPPEERANLHLNGKDDRQKVYFWQRLSNRDAYNKTWEEIKYAWQNNDNKN